MYNDKIKRDFLTEYGEKRADSMVKRIHTFFNKTALFEAELGKDLYEMSEDELLSCIRQTGYKPKAFKTPLGALRIYYQWAIDNGIIENTVDISAEKYSVSDLMAAIYFDGDVYISEEELLQICERIPEEFNRTYFTAVLFAIYYGLDDGNECNLDTASTNDLGLRSVGWYDQVDTFTTKEKRVVAIPHHLAITFRNAARLTSFNNGLTAISKPHVTSLPIDSRQDETIIFKQGTRINNDKYPNRRWARFITRINDSLGTSLTYDSIRDSGTFTMIAEACERSGQNLKADMESGNEALTVNGANKRLVYNRIFNDIGLTITWDDFYKKYKTWVRFLKDA